MSIDDCRLEGQATNAVIPKSSIINRQSTISYGFTLVEVVLVALALALLLMATLPNFQKTAQRLRAEQTAFEFTQLLRYAHERAVAEGHATSLVWDPDAQRAGLEVIQDDGQPLRLSERAARSAPLAGGLSVSLSRESSLVDRITFFPDGTSEPALLRVLYDEHDYTVTVDAATSQVVLATGSAPR